MGVVTVRFMRASLLRRRDVRLLHAARQSTALRSSYPTVAMALQERTGTLRFASSSPAVKPDDASVLALLERSLAERQPQQALSYFNRLKTPPNQLLSQKLAMLLAKRGDRVQTDRAVEILRGVYMLPALKPDDYTKLASIYVVDACLRHNRLDQALEIYEEAFNVGVTLDLPAYDAMIQALVDADRVDDATELLHEISADNDVSPTERSYLPLLTALIERQDYHTATVLLQKGRARDVEFTSETFYPLVELAEADDDAPDSLVSFLSYVENVWDEAKLLDHLAEADDDDDEDLDFDHDEEDDENPRR
ncbi:hypothetical protein Poli38472_007480 [Pythium oligandrum]|uniref:PROP1-like PPR domain-containing protein n=1 Tax=Pythium oligandrum TaxID=41045 RepID=A0A8K1CT43_PYTOL|nr:hypothetical protein Poli38472_007480 [Pythium oligandrum]|eukprot:TMW67808.1 hypothetical protein Poli38472_007480 [Pythium oligandrum]